MSTNEQEVTRQMRIILQGAESVISEADLRQKVTRSLETGRPLTIKFGLDPSAPDIHLGHAVPLRKIRQMQELGHRAVIIIGDFTGRIGDPTGRSKSRKVLSNREVLENADTYRKQVFRVLDPERTEVRYNGEWLELLNLEECLRLASTTTVARMLERDDFQNRYKNNIPISLHEFFYPLLQAYDSVVIEADIELGGTDQTFNILMGRSLQKDRGLEPQAALFMPILEGTDGVEKMSKSLGNYIGVDEEPSVMFKKVMEVPDDLIIRYFELTTDILPEELDEIREKLDSGCNPRDVKLILARTVTGLYHTPEETAAAERFFTEAFTRREIPGDVEGLRLDAIADTVGGTGIQGVLDDGTIPLLRLAPVLVEKGFVKSVSEFRRLIAQGGVQVNGQKAEGLETVLKSGDVVRVGKKRFVRVEF